MIPVMNKDKKEDNKSEQPKSEQSYTSQNQPFNEKNVSISQFRDFYKLQKDIKKEIETDGNPRNQPISFGERLGMKIEERVSDSFIDKMLGGMFTTGGTNPIKPPEGVLAVIRTVLDSGYFQQAGARMPETIEALRKAIGEQRTEQLADAVVQAVNPKKSGGVSTEDEQRKMEEHVLSLNPVNIMDIKKFMDLVNANPANAKITDTDQARNILIEEQDRIRRDRKLLSPGIEENPDIDRGQPMRQSPMGQRDNFMDSMMGTTPMGRMGSSNQMTSEQILTLDPRDDASVTSYAWSQGHGQIIQEPNGINKVRNILMRHQDDLMKQASGLGGPVEQPMTGEQPLTTEVVQGDFGWNEEDIGKKGVGRMDKKGEVLVPLHIADSSVTKDGEVKEDRSQIMELLQKMANNFDNGVNELNNKLQMMENRINNIESSTLPIQPAKIPIDTETPIEIPTEIIQNTINDLNLQDDQKIEDDVEDDQKIDDELILQEDVKSNIQVVSTKDETWWKNKKDDVEEVEDKKNIVSMIRENDSNDVPISVLDEPSKPTKEHVKGSMGWLKEQKRLKEQRAKR